MLSRVAGNVYWLFRYLERAQNIARFLNSDFQQYLEDRPGHNNLWRSLIAVTGDLDLYEERFPEVTAESVIGFLTTDESYPNSILRCITQARENARSVRESISSEMWEEVNSLYLKARCFHVGDDPFQLCRDVIASGYHLLGLFYSTMNRSEAWHFAQIGMLLERADKTSRILDVKYFILLPDPTWVGSVYDNTQWAALLKSVSGLEMYRKAYKRIGPREVAEFLIYDRGFPRSILHCIHYAEDSLKIVSPSPRNGALNAAQKSLFRLRTELETGSVAEVMQFGLHGYLDGLQTRLNRIDDHVTQVFFAWQSDETGKDDGNTGQSQS